MWDRVWRYVERVYADNGLWPTLGALLLLGLAVVGVLWLFGIDVGGWLP